MLVSDSQQRSLILAALSEIGTCTLKPMGKVMALSLQDDNPEVRVNAIRDITQIYDQIAQIGHILYYASEDSDPEVKQTAAWALSKLQTIRSAADLDRLNQASGDRAIPGPQPNRLPSIRDDVDCSAAGVVLVAEGRFSEALPLLEEAIRRDASDPQAQRALAETLDAQGKTGSALQAWVTARDLYLDRGDAGAAATIQDWLRDRNLDPDAALYHCSLGNLQLQQGYLDDAIQTLQTAIHHNPYLPKPHVLLGRVYQQQGHPTTAAACFRAACDLYVELGDAAAAKSMQQATNRLELR